MSLNKFFDYELGRDLELNIGCQDCVIDNVLNANFADFNDLTINNELKINKLTIEDDLTINGNLTAENVLCDNITTDNIETNNLVVKGIYFLGDNEIKSTPGDENYVLTSNGANVWEMKPPFSVFPNTYGFLRSYTQAISSVVLPVAPTFRRLGEVGGAINEQNFIDVEDYYELLIEDEVKVKQAGQYRVDGYVDLEEKTSELVIMCFLVNDTVVQTSPQIKQQVSGGNKYCSFFISDVLTLNANDKITLGLAVDAGSSDARVDEWKFNIMKSY